MLLKFLIVTIFLTISAIKQKEVKMIGGDPVTEELQKKLFNHHVAVKDYESNMWCGGSIIDRQRIVTAAHCVYNRSNIYIRAGSLNATYGGTVVNVSDINVYPDYNTGVANDHDIAVLTLKTPLNFTASIGPIRIANSSDIYIYKKVGTLLTACGYGRSEYSNSDSLLRYIQLPILDFEECKKDYAPEGDIVTENMFCLGNQTMKFFAEGDSGGCSFLHNTTTNERVCVGIISWGMGDVVHPWPQVQVKISNYYDWIYPKEQLPVMLETNKIIKVPIN